MKPLSPNVFIGAQAALPFALDPQWVERAPAGFWNRVDVRDADECWPWTGSLNCSGYGNYSPMQAHKTAFVAAKGDMPLGYECGHDCHHAECCNPRHIVPKTHKQNMIEKGERHRGRALRVLTDAIVATARIMVAAGRKIVEVAQEFGVKAATLRLAVRGITWARVATPPVYI